MTLKKIYPLSFFFLPMNNRTSLSKTRKFKFHNCFQLILHKQLASYLFNIINISIRYLFSNYTFCRQLIPK